MEHKRPRSGSDDGPRDKNQEAINRRREQMNFEIAEAMHSMFQSDSGDADDEDEDDVMSDALPELPALCAATARSSSQDFPFSSGQHASAAFALPTTPLSQASTLAGDLALQLGALPETPVVESETNLGSALRPSQQQQQSSAQQVLRNIGQRQRQLREQRRASSSNETMLVWRPARNDTSGINSSSSSSNGSNDNRPPTTADLSVAVQPPLFVRVGEVQPLPFVVRADRADDGKMFTVRPARETAATTTSLAPVADQPFSASSAMDEVGDHLVPLPVPGSGVRFPSRFRHHDGVPMRSQDSREAPFQPAAFAADMLPNRAALFRELPLSRRGFDQAARRHHKRTPATGAGAEAYCLLSRFWLARPGSWRVGVVTRDWNGDVTGAAWSREMVVVDRPLTLGEREANETDRLLRRDAEDELLERLRVDAEHRGEPWP